MFCTLYSCTGLIYARARLLWRAGRGEEEQGRAHHERSGQGAKLVRVGARGAGVAGGGDEPLRGGLGREGGVLREDGGDGAGHERGAGGGAVDGDALAVLPGGLHAVAGGGEGEGRAGVGEADLLAGAVDGAEALRSATETRPDAIVLDINMPVLDGVSVVTALRAMDNDVPVCVLSARSSVDDRVAGLEAGADDYLTKPFDLGELVARLHALLRRAAASEAASAAAGGDEGAAGASPLGCAPPAA